MPKVSIIIPMKNEENFIGLCLESIVNNTYPKEFYEIICIDNGSTDKTLEVVKKYTDNIHILPKKNISFLRNFGVKKAIGEYVAFIDADCIADHRWLEKASKYFDKKEPACFGSTPEVPENATWVQKTWYINKEGRKEVQPIDWLESMNLFVRRDIFLEIGGFNDKLETCEDVDLCFRIRDTCQIISDRRIKVVHLGEAKTLHEFFIKEKWRGKSNLKGLRSHRPKIKELPSIIAPIYYVALFILLPLIFLASSPLFLFCALFFLPPLLIALKILSKHKRYHLIPQLSVVYLVYFLARAVSLLPDFTTKVRNRG